ncbi:hypothetical protein N308_11861, partial [Struthio camelus australis]
EQPKKFEYKEQKWRSSRPPLTKVRLGLDLEQHELSVIPEIDTPRSCNISFEDKVDSAGGESSPISAVGESACVSCYNRAVHKDGRLPGSVTNREEQIPSESPRENKQSSRLLKEILM